MALTPKERENIIEEETLRQETRKNLHGQHCCCGKRRRCLWIVAGILLVFFLFGRIFCGHGACGWGHGYGMMGEGKHCAMAGHGPEEAPMGQPAKK